MHKKAIAKITAETVRREVGPGLGTAQSSFGSKHQRENPVFDPAGVDLVNGVMPGTVMHRTHIRPMFDKLSSSAEAKREDKKLNQLQKAKNASKATIS